jgi:hypothetical protein
MGVGTLGCANETRSGTTSHLDPDAYSAGGAAGAFSAGGAAGADAGIDVASEGGVDRGDEPAPVREPVCDGTDRARLILARGGGDGGSGGARSPTPTEGRLRS